MQSSISNRVKALDGELLRLHRYDTDLFEELTAFQQALGILHGDRPICPFLRPYFLSKSRYTAISNAAASLYEAFGSITSAALEYDEILSELGVSEKEERWARLEPGYSDAAVTSRLDTFLSEDGFAFLEYNSENPAGIGDQPALAKLFTRVPAVKRFLAETPHYYPQPQIRLLESLDHAYRAFGGQKEKPNIAIVDWDGVSTGAEFEILKEHFESEEYATQVCDPDELDYQDGRLRAGSFEIDVFYKRVIIHEFLERFDEQHPVYRACLDGALCMANSFRSKIAHKKACFAILTDDRYHRLFSNRELDAIRAHAPWTRVVRSGMTTYHDEKVDLIDQIRSARTRFVLKPNDDYGGKGIYIGWEASVSEWDDAIEEALRSPYVVQERVPVERTDIPVFSNGEAYIESLTVDLDPFLFRGEVEGGMVRLAAGSVVNISQGGGETALVVLKDI